MRLKPYILFFLIPGMLAWAGNGNGNGGVGNGNGNGNAKHRTPGTNVGTYNVKMAGQYSGSGSAAVSTTTISISATVKIGGTQGPLVVSGLTLVQNRFTGTGTIMGAPCTIEGRVDLPAATDDEETNQQAETGRILATVRDASGKMVIMVGVQAS